MHDGAVVVDQIDSIGVVIAERRIVDQRVAFEGALVLAGQDVALHLLDPGVHADEIRIDRDCRVVPVHVQSREALGGLLDLVGGKLPVAVGVQRTQNPLQVRRR